ncbi:RAD55 family ATPase [Rubripirellula reticaptiva]|uniref:Circadian clock protein kinase KaiC n=1 Tax=Rubripirellula reticaptiva TaxID=2528013 RepID=A0A5C6EHG2_9BACT|nr:ATPase domain-containing protein [Rubripirellula reticaptiva]TWU47924.1 Circadian clock protein kinase KaiC [Rubripirellula reticaptiva]
MTNRLQTGIAQLDDMLGGGLLPGKLTVVMGATGIGKTQLGIRFANQGAEQEGERGVFFDLTSRGDSQNHRDYANRMFGWELTAAELVDRVDAAAVWDRDRARRDSIHLFRDAGRRVTAADMDDDGWRRWKYEQAKKLDQAIAFFYGNFVHGVRRVVIDGIEPVDRAAQSIQFELFEYVYQQILRKEHDWLARDLFRVAYRENADRVTQAQYDHNSVGCAILATSHEVMLDDLISRPIESGDVLSNANTIILMGKTRDGNKMGRALCVAKHRGSACDETIVPFTIDDGGIVLE